MSPNGVGKDLFKANQNHLHKVILTNNDWHMYQQRESGVAALHKYSLFTQSLKVVVQMELFELRVVLEDWVLVTFPCLKTGLLLKASIAVT